LKRVAKELGERMTDEELQEICGRWQPPRGPAGSSLAALPRMSTRNLIWCAARDTMVSDVLHNECTWNPIQLLVRWR